MVAFRCHIYYPPKKLREGKVFSHVCHSVQGSHVIITHDALELTIQGHTLTSPLPPPPGPHCTGTPPPPPTCLNLFNLNSATPPPKHVQLTTTKLVHYEALHNGWQTGCWHTTGMLSCFLTYYIYRSVERRLPHDEH